MADGVEAELTIGLDLGGTKILGALVRADGSVAAEERVPTPEGGADTIVETLATLASTVAAQGGADVSAVGVGAAGMIDGEGTVRYAPNIKALVEFPLQRRLAERTGVPVVVDNDANTAAWGEVVHGAARGVDEALVVTLGTGIGGGIVTGGRLLRGAHGFAAEIGHFALVENGPVCACGGRGHWEALASGTALGRMARERAVQGDIPAVTDVAGGDPADVTGEHLTEAALGGDEAALALVEDFAWYVGVGLAGLGNILDPAVIVVGGGLVSLGDVLLDPVRATFAELVEAADHRPPIDIVPARLGEQAGAIGAAALARDRLRG